MQTQRPGLWVEIALTLALITLATILLNAGIFWLILQEAEEARRTELALSLSGALTAQLEVEATGEEPAEGYRRILSAYKASELAVDELYVVDRQRRLLAGLVQEPAATGDRGLRAALESRTQFTEVQGSVWGDRAVVITSPIAPRGEAVGALRVRMPLVSPSIPGGPWGFVLAYTGLSGLVIALFGFALFRRRLLGPIRDIQEGTMRIAGGEFGHLVQTDASRELLELTSALNTMSASLKAYRERTLQQVADLEAANEELRQAQEALVRSEKLAGVGRLAAGLAHEVGNPLSAVLGYVELLGQDLDDPATEADLVERSQRELARIHRIIRQLLDYARVGTGEAEDVDVSAALAQAAETVRAQPGLRHRTLVVEAEEGLPPVHMERDKLHQVLVNLLVNAAHAMGEGEAGRVRLVARGTPAGNVEIRCEDEGPGFSEVALDRALEPFFTTKDVGQGTGLGLATCLQVVEQAGGTLVLGNREEGGACVRIRLPSAS